MTAADGTLCNNRSCDNVLPPYVRGVPKKYCSEQCRWDCYHSPLLRRHDPRRDGCSHSDFVANVEVARLFSTDDAMASSARPDSLAITVSAFCKACNAAATSNRSARRKVWG